MEHGKHSVRARLAAAVAGRKARPHAQPGWSAAVPGKREAAGRRTAGTAAALGHQAVLLLAVQAMYAAANALSGTFVPVYLWKASESFAVIGWFTITQHLVSALTFWVTGRWVKSHNKMNSLRAGIVCSGLFYLAVLLLGPDASRYIVPLGGLAGVASGFFWLAYNVVYFEITEPGNRDRFNGWAGLLGSCAGMVAPWISGLVIGLSGGVTGYRIIFAVSLGIFAVAAVMSFFLAKRESGGRYEWLYGVKQLRVPGSPWRRVVPSLMAQGMREGVFMFLLGLLVFFSTGKEQSLGNFTLWTSLVSLVSFWLIGRRLRPGNRGKAMLAGAAAVSVLTSLLFFDVSFTVLLLLGIGTALFMPLYVIPMTSAVFDLIGASEESADKREELIVLRESGLIAGRVTGLSIYLAVVAFTQSTAALTWLLFAVGAAPVAGWLFMRGRFAAQAGR